LSDHDVLVRELLEERVPLRLDAEPDWAEVLDRAGLNGNRRQLRPRRMLVPALVVLAFVLTGVAIAAAVGGIPWWETAPPPVNPGVVDFELAKDVDSPFPPSPDRSRARTVAQADGASLVAAPVGDDGYCLILFLPGDLGSHGHSCEYQATDYMRSYTRRVSDGNPYWVVYGRIVDPKAAAFDLTEAAGFPLLVPLHYSGFFLASVPQDRWQALSYHTGPTKILDHSGATMRTQCFTWGPAPGDAAPSEPYGSLAEAPCHFVIARYPWLIDVRDATKLVELALRPGRDVFEPAPGVAEDRVHTIAIWRAPQKDGSVCVLYALGSPKPNPPRSSDPGRPAPPGENPFTGWNCGDWGSLQATRSGRPIEVSVHADQSNGDPADWRLDGHVNPDSRIADLELRHPSTADVRFVYANGWFLGQLPTSDAWKTFPNGGPFVLVGYDSDGHEIARVDLEEAWRAEMKRIRG
jgi:hypothetical protein